MRVQPAPAAARVMQRLDELAGFSAEPDALTRFYLTPEHKQAALKVAEWMRAGGMEAEIDALGTVVGRYEGTKAEAPALLLGSHLDTVRNAGRYDGSFGIIAAIEAVAALAGAGKRLPFPIEVLAFGDEESLRFPVALSSSHGVAGTFDPAVLKVRDAAGISLHEALVQFGCNPAEIPAIARHADRVRGYLELHIEQGPVLETEDLPIGIVTAIAGASRYTITVSGQAGHAGTVPMALRHDALAAAAEMILAIERTARASETLVATVGRIEALPGAANVIPSTARFSLDIRNPIDTLRQMAQTRLHEDFAAIAARRGVTLAIEQTYEEHAAVCDPELSDALAAAIRRAGFREKRLPSGAGHDGLAMIALCPITMLFVRCKGGLSHNPAEAITLEDAAVAIAVLLDTLCHLR